MIPLLTGINSTSAALDAERLRMEVVSQNIANANVTRGPDGKPYQRQQVIFESVMNQARLGGPTTPGADAATVRVSRVEGDQRPSVRAFRPGHPDADAKGFITLPNVSIHEEMVDYIASSRAFEANLTVVKNARQMAQQTLSLGKR
jgi:flagellar basal-body rod protein FlgC